MSATRPAPRGLTMPIGVSAVLHVGMIATALALRPAPKPTPPVMYKVELVAAPQGPVAAGVVGEEAPTPTPEPPAPAKARAVPKAKATVPAAKPVPVAKGAKPAKAAATPSLAPSTSKAPAGRAGSATGGEGTDVVGIKTDGIVFPYRGYLDNIVRQIYLNFSPRGATNLSAEVFFMIRRDGSVANFRWLQRSGSQVFDLECQGAIEAAGKAFGPLPAGFTDDVLPVRFSFDPSKIR